MMSQKLFFRPSRLIAAILLALFAASNASPGPYTPMQQRLAYAGDDGMFVSWNTYKQLSNPTVYYGTSLKSLSKSASSTVSITYKTSTTYNNHVKVTGLKPDTLYYYRPSYGSEIRKFKTSRAPGDLTPYQVAAVVDLGTMGELGLSHHVGNGAANPLKKGENNTIESLNYFQHQFDFVWHSGDIAYADYWLKEEFEDYIPKTGIKNGYEVYETILNKYYDQMAKITAYKPYMVGPGNHEANCDNGGTTNPANNKSYTVNICMEGQRNFTGYRHHFRMPSAESGGTENFWYSWDHGMTHYVQLDTETDLGHGFISPDAPGGAGHEDAGPFNSHMNAQTNWLKRDLAAVDRTKTPWIIVAGHRPWYIAAQNDTEDLCTICKDVFEPLFNTYGVDLVLSGHVHVYQRNTPIANYKIDPRGLDNPTAPWYITNGAAGHYDGLDTLVRPLEKYAVFAQDKTYGWSRLKFHNCTHLTHEFVASGDGTVLDRATLYKKRTC